MPDRSLGDRLGDGIYYVESTGNYAVSTYDDNYDYYTCCIADGRKIAVR